MASPLDYETPRKSRDRSAINFIIGLFAAIGVAGVICAIIIAAAYLYLWTLRT